MTLIDQDILEAERRSIRAEVLAIVAKELELGQDTIAGLWMHVFRGGDDNKQESWMKAWTFARTITDRVEDVI